MKIEELNPEQIGKARALATNEERLEYMKTCGVKLDEDVMANVTGGASSHHNSRECPKSEDGQHDWFDNGNRRPGKVLGIFDDHEYTCRHCGKTVWRDF